MLLRLFSLIFGLLVLAPIVGAGPAPTQLPLTDPNVKMGPTIEPA